MVQLLSHYLDAVHGSLPTPHFSPSGAQTSPPAWMDKPLALSKDTWAHAAGLLLEPDKSWSLQLHAVHMRRSPRKGISHIAADLQPAWYLSTREQMLLHWDAPEMQLTLTSNSSDGQWQHKWSNIAGRALNYTEAVRKVPCLSVWQVWTLCSLKKRCHRPDQSPSYCRDES